MESQEAGDVASKRQDILAGNLSGLGDAQRRKNQEVLKERRGDRWLGLATVNGDPNCGLVVVLGQSGEVRIEGQCWVDHSHGAVIEEVVGMLMAKGCEG